MASSTDPSIYNYQGRSINAIIWTMGTVATIIVALRLYCSWFLLRKAFLADFVMIAALALHLTHLSLVTLATQTGLGRHMADLTRDQINETIKYQVMAGPLFLWAGGLGRISLAIYLLQLAHAWRPERWTLHACIYLTMAVNLVSFGLFFKRSELHPSSSSDPNEKPGASSDLFFINFAFFQGAFNGLTDLVLTIIPGLIVWKMKVSVRTKIGLVLLLGISLLAAVSCVIGTTKLKDAYEQSDVTYELMPFTIWPVVENSILITASSIPLTRYVFLRKTRTNRVPGTSSTITWTDASKKHRSSIIDHRSDGFFFPCNNCQVVSLGRPFRVGSGILTETTTTVEQVIELSDDVECGHRL